MVNSWKKIFLVIAVVFLLCACSKEENSDAAGKNSRTDTKDGTASGLFAACSIGGMNNELFFSDRCFYCNDDGLLHMYDIGKKEDILFCFDPECGHGYGVLGSIPKCTARQIQPESYPMMSSRYFYYYSEYELEKTRLLRTDRDTSNEKVLAEFDGSLTTAFASGKYIISFLRNAYQFNAFGEMTEREKMSCRVVITDAESGESRMVMEAEDYYCATDKAFVYDGVLYFFCVRISEKFETYNEELEQAAGDMEKIREINAKAGRTELFSVGLDPSSELKKQDIFIEMSVDHKTVSGNAYFWYDEDKGKLVRKDLENGGEKSTDVGMVSGMVPYGCDVAVQTAEGECILYDGKSLEIKKKTHVSPGVRAMAFFDDVVYYEDLNINSNGYRIVIDEEDFWNGDTGKGTLIK